VFELEEQLSELQMYAIGHLLSTSHLFHYKLLEIPVDIDRSPKVSALITSIDVNHSSLL
jgi:hypothetical protein